MWPRSLIRYGISNTPKVGETELMIVDGMEKASWPSLSFCSIVSSLPSWDEP